MTALVPVRTDLDGQTFLALERLAKKHGVTVGKVLADLARHYVTPEDKRPKRLGRPPAIKPEQIHQMIELYELHYSDGAIAERLGVSIDAVKRTRYKHNLPSLRGRGRYPRKDA